MKLTRAFADPSCQDYYATIYSAEVVNCFTNVLFMYLAYKGLANCYRNKHDTVFFMAYLSYLFIGVGSFLFHSTLKCTYSALSRKKKLEALYKCLAASLPWEPKKSDMHEILSRRSFFISLQALRCTHIRLGSVEFNSRPRPIHLSLSRTS